MSTQQDAMNDQRRQMIAEAAYFKAERRGFNGGDAVRDWCEAEAEIDARLRRGTDGQLIERIETVLDAAAKRLSSVRRKVARLSQEAREEWQRDIDRLATLRETLALRLDELKEQGERAGRKLREQADTIREEVAELAKRLETKGKR